MTHLKAKKIYKHLAYVLPILILSLALIQTIQTTHAQTTTNPWAIKLQILNNQNTTATAFQPFDPIRVRATVTYNNASQPDVLVSFNIVGPSADPTKITRIETTTTNGQAEFSFRLPIEGQNEDALIGTWNVTATVNNAQPKSSSFTTQWNIEAASISLLDSHGQNQTVFSPGSTVTVQATMSNKGPAQTANVTINMQDSTSQSINQTEILNSQIASSNQTQVEAALQIPDNAALGWGTINVAIYSGTYNGTNIPAAENQNVYFTVASNSTASPTPTPSPTPTATPTPTPNPFVENSISLFSWLLVATGFFTFTLLVGFLRRKPTPKIGTQMPEMPATQTYPTITVPLEKSSLEQPSTQQLTPTAKTAPEKTIQAAATTQILGIYENWESQTTQPTGAVAEYLSKISDVGKRVQDLEASLKVEREQLGKEIMSLNKVLEEQERAVKNYCDLIRQSIAKINPDLYDKKETSTQPKDTSE